MDQSAVAESEAHLLESGAGSVFGDQLPAELEASVRPGDGLGTDDHLGTEARDLLEPTEEGLDPTKVRDSPGAERIEEASSSRPGALIGSLREGLFSCPLEALMEILPEESSSMAGTRSSGELVEAILYAQLQLSFIC
jgi:hypothetical protein